MKKMLVIIGLAIVAFAIFFVIYNVQNSQSELHQITEAECSQAGGYWYNNFCNCGGLAGFSCPEGYRCHMQTSIPDSLGECVYGK